MVEINWLAVALAVVSSMVVGSVWYMPQVFGKTWLKLIGKTQKDMAKIGGWRPIIIAVLVSFVTAYVLAHLTYLAHAFYGGDYTFLAAALFTAFWVWLGFTAARFLTHDSFEGRPGRLTLLNVTHELVTIMAMGLIIGLLGV